jgi:hypothetical protein
MLLRAALTTVLTTGLTVHPSVAQQPEVSEKAGRSAAQQKIDSQLLFEIYRRRGEAEAKGVPPGETRVRVDARGRALVDVRAPVTPALGRRIRDLGGLIVSSASQHQSTIARIPLLQIEALAALPSVRFIAPAAEATTNRRSQ